MAVAGICAGFLLGLAAAAVPARGLAGETAAARIAGKPAAPVELRVLRNTPAAPGERFEVEIAVTALMPAADLALEWRSSPDVAIETGVRRRAGAGEPLVLQLSGRRTASGVGRLYVVAWLDAGGIRQRRALAVDVGGRAAAPHAHEPDGRVADGLRILPAEVTEGLPPGTGR